MTPITDIETYFIAVPAGAVVAENDLLLTARVVVEWRLPAEMATPEWLKKWGRASVKLGVRLESDSGPIDAQNVPQVKADDAKTALDLTADRNKIGDPVAQGTARVLRISPTIQRSAAIAAAMIQGSGRPETAAPESIAFIDSFQPKKDESHELHEARVSTSATASVAGDMVSSRLASRYPAVGKEIGLAWDVTLRVKNWAAYIDKTLWLICTTSFDKSAVITPYTRCVIRRSEGELYWCPELVASNSLADAGAEGLIRMQPMQTGQPNWFLESAEYISTELHQSVYETSKSAAPTKTLAETGGIALACEGIDQVLATVPRPPDRNGHAVLTWNDLFVGFRVDVLNASSAWCSLTGREMKFGGHSIQDEGFVETGTIVPPSGGAGWKFEEVLRWGGTSLVGCAEYPDVGGSALRITPRSDPEAKQRWNQSYSMGLRPVFKGGWSLSVDQAGRLRKNDKAKKVQTPSYVYLREDKLGAPGVEGLPNDKSIHQLHLTQDEDPKSPDGGKLQRRIRFAILPPNVSRSSIKRSGVLDHLADPKAQAALLNEAAQPCEVKDDQKFSDPWAAELEIEVNLFGTSAVLDCKEIDQKDTNLYRGTSYLFRLPWRAKSKWPKFDRVFLEIAAGDKSIARPSGKSLSLEIAPGDHLNITLRAAIPALEDVLRFAPSNRIATVMASGVWTYANSRSSLDQMSAAAVGKIKLHQAGLKASVGDCVLLDARHVTREPIAVPERTDPRVEREAGDLQAYLYDVIRVDRQTTGDVLVDAQWEDWEKGQYRMTRSTKNLASIPYALGAEAAEDYGTAGELLRMAEIKLQLPFSDTRRRNLRLRLRARARYADLYKGGGKDKVGPAFDVVIPSSKRPASPDVRIVVPAMITKDTSNQSPGSNRTWRHEFHGERLRVYLGNEWFDSGDGEMLGVVCAPDSQGALSDADRRALKSYFTQWGGEPLLATPAVQPGPFTRHFPLSSKIFDGTQSTTGKKGGHPVTAIVAGHEVQYDESARQYFADILVDGHGSPYTWIRLALVRLQMESVKDTNVSPTVTAQFAQPMPDRWITATVSEQVPRTVRVAALRTPVPDHADAKSSNTSAEARLFVRANLEELNSTAADVRLFEGQLWRGDCKTALIAHSIVGEHSHWLGELSAPRKGEVVVVVSEYFTPPGSKTRILQWEGSIRVGDGGGNQ
jgi:hypothetical protein